MLVYADDMTDEAFEAMYQAATKAGLAAEEVEPRAIAAHYDSTTGRVAVDLWNGCRFEFPAAMGQGLAGATVEQLKAIEILGTGSTLHWEALDADLSVPLLLEGIFGSRTWMAKLRAERAAMGRKGGAARTPAKIKAVRENGKRGGRPRRQASPPDVAKG